MKKITAVVIALALCLSLAACGSSARADDALVGKYIAVSGTALGVTLTGDDVSDFTLDVKSGGKATISVEGTDANGKWTNDDTTFTLTVDGTDMVGQIGQDTITFEGFLEEMVGVSMDMKFAKEGTDAAKPENNLPPEEMALLGSWTSVSVLDVFDEDASGEIDPDAMEATFNADHTASFKYCGESLGTNTWSYVLGSVLLDDDFADDVSLYIDYEDDVLTITYSGDDYYTFTMEK